MSITVLSPFTLLIVRSILCVIVTVFLTIAPNHISEGAVLPYPIVRSENICVAQLLAGAMLIQFCSIKV
ncbi:uncharacterized protein B0J16DRAFT_332493 [Fusarium flagelliforme]|uniref:uncharacterized protein n=1 Tax=Fusarium flagelliforme TaxID=2675880 RepID=UPI001E8D1EB2|nr:uncharacterized protein B0J16DRAFT_332493 [Fusarium flagelliforme]KAH7192187.1 hypothetical protein B0J16DRAFT_332493 [Fusarium flagelliforme]